MDEFLFCYKPLEINQSLGLYQFIARGTNYRLIKSLVSSERNWKMEFFFISGFWVGNLAEVGRYTFAPYTRDLGNLRLEGMPLPPPLFSLSFFFYFLFIYLFLSFVYERLTFLFFFFFLIAVGRPSLSKFYCDRVHTAHLYVDRSFHSLVTLQHLARWGLGS